MDTYLHERLLPYLNEKKKLIKRKEKAHKGLLLSSMIVLISGLALYLLGICIPILNIACKAIALICFASSALLFLFDYMFYRNYRKQSKHIAEIEELMNLCKYQNQEFNSFIENIKP